MRGAVGMGFAEHILHVDMDAFYVEVERQRDPRLRGVAVVVGGLGKRGVVAAASYEARAHGVRSAMPIVEARRRLPRARYVPPDHRRYGEVSKEVFAILRSFTPLVEALSVDEAFLDISGLRLHYESPVAVGAAIRARLATDLGLPGSVGGATTKFIAKLASEEAKPDGMLVVPAGEELDFLHPLPVRRLWGVGKAAHAALEGLGINTIGELAAVRPPVLEQRVGSALGKHLAALASGRDDREVEVGGAAKSISVEETYPDDLRKDDEIGRALLSLCDRLSVRMRRSDKSGRTVTLKVRLGDFKTLTRSRTLDAPISHTSELWYHVQELLAEAAPGDAGVRLLGVALSGLGTADETGQLSMMGPGAAGDVVDRIRDRFGDDAVVPARLVDGMDRKNLEDPSKS